MMCEYFSAGKRICVRGMPVERLYMELICGKSPEKCPLVTAGTGFEFASSGLGLFEDF